MLNAEIAKETQALLGLITTLETKTPTYRSCRQAMGTILAALKELGTGLWPHAPEIISPVPDKITFRMAELLLTYRHRKDGIYLEEKVDGALESPKSVRVNHIDLTAETVQRAVLERLNAFYRNVVEAATT
jgi:hypothetical protein